VLLIRLPLNFCQIGTTVDVGVDLVRAQDALDEEIALL